jgi:signal transduction histidine kinase
VKILVAEDNDFYRRMLASTLREWGYDVVCTRDGEEAWQVIREKDHPKLAIVDWMMPGPDGLELCRRVRASAEAEPTYVILLTAKDGKANVVTGLKAGADDYISKPFDIEELQTRIQVGRRIVELQASLAARVTDLEHALSGAQKMEAVGRLAGGVAHDFNNLLTVIVAATELLLTQLADERQRELVETILHSGQRGAALTRQLLAFSRKQVLQPEVLQLNALITNVQRLLRRLIGEHIDLVTELDPELGRVRADPGQIEQVLMNLVVNARDAMPQGGRLVLATRNVTLQEAAPGTPHTIPPGDYAVVAVRDNGSGMDEYVKAHLFEPFFTTKGPGKGTGLGLATVYGIVHQTGGRLAVHSGPGRGSVFEVYLPRTEQRLSGPQDGSEKSVKPGKRETILVVEDEDAVRAMTRLTLQHHSYTVLAARDGVEALRSVTNGPSRSTCS